MNDLSGTDGGKVTVALICKDDLIRVHAADAGSNRRSASVCGLAHIDVHEMMRIDRAADRHDADRIAERSSLLEALHDNSMCDTVSAARTVGCIDRDHTLGWLKYCFHFVASFNAFSARSAISMDDGTIPPVRLMRLTGQRP